MLEEGRKKVIDGSIYFFFLPSSKKIRSKKMIPYIYIYTERVYLKSLFSIIYNIDSAKPEIVFRRKFTFHFALE